VTLLDGSGAVLSSVALPDAHGGGHTYAFSAASSSFEYTTQPTPDAANVIVAPALPVVPASSTSTVVISEVADKGTTGTCAGRDWVELFNPTASAVALAGYVLHDDKGAADGDSYTFPAGSSLSGGGFLLLCCADEAAVPVGPKFKVGGDDTITLLDSSGASVSTTGALPNSGKFDQTYSLLPTLAEFAVTATATPAAANVITAPAVDWDAHAQALAAQNALGGDFFGMNGDGSVPANAMDHIIDLSVTMNAAVLEKMWDEQS